MEAENETGKVEETAELQGSEEEVLKDMYGELNALLDEITGSKTEVKKPDPLVGEDLPGGFEEETKSNEVLKEPVKEDTETLETVEEGSDTVEEGLSVTEEGELTETLDSEDVIDESTPAENDEMKNLNECGETEALDVEKNQSPVKEIISDPPETSSNPVLESETCVTSDLVEQEIENSLKSEIEIDETENSPENVVDEIEKSEIVVDETEKSEIVVDEVKKSAENVSVCEKIPETSSTEEQTLSVVLSSPNPIPENPDEEAQTESQVEPEKEAEIPKLIETSVETITDNETSTKTTSNDEETNSSLKSNENEQVEKNPDDEIISLLKKLSPEKLEVIKSKIFNDKINSPDLEQKEMEIDESTAGSSKQDETPAPSAPGTSEPATKPDSDDDCVILLDSDEEAEPAAVEKPEVSEKIEVAKPPEESSASQTKRKLEENKENNPRKISKTSKECVNPDCPRDCDEFVESPSFVLSFYYTQRKFKIIQYVCSGCYEKAIIKYEELGEALLNNKPLYGVTIHKKHDMVEVIDSDEEDEPGVKREISDAEKILFTRADELQVEEILQEICNKVDMKRHLEWDREALRKGIDTLEADQAGFEEELKLLERKSTMMYNQLYSVNRPKIQNRPPLDITHELDGKPSPPKPPPPKPPPPQQRFVLQPAPPRQTLSRPLPGSKIIISPQMPTRSMVVAQTSQQQVTKAPEVLHDQIHYAIRSRIQGKMQNWAPCKLLETLVEPDGKKLYRVEFLDSLSNPKAIVRGKEFALNTVNPNLTIGSRVIALFSRSVKKFGTKKFLPGVIGEKLSKYNNNRYLVFCDYGQVEYASPDSVREVSEVSPQVWDDVHENLKQFIKDYLQSQTQRQRALLNVRLSQRVATERNNSWRTAVVVEIDCSVVKMFFSDDGTYEWLYRGSKRLGPLYSQGQRGVNNNARRNDPLITYIAIDDEVDQQQEPSESEKKNTARKSTAPKAVQQQQTVAAAPGAVPQKTIILNDNNIYLEEPNKVTKFRHFTPRKEIAAKKYTAHKCSTGCLPKQSNNLSSYSPLTKPLLTCWERQIVRQKANRWVQYKGPCGRRLRNMYEIREYLNITGCKLNVDNFDFNPDMQVLSAYDVADKSLCPLYIADMSEGKEGMKIPVVNAFDDTAPPKLEYSASRIPMKGVNINTDPDFMACCDCTDDCADKNKCACFQLTIQGHKYANRGSDSQDESISYVWKRLLSTVTTGIYECHSRCKCTSRCLNKVVQQPIQIKMQLYRTKNRGWGLECCHDIPKGTFICIYAGRLYTEDDANALCQGLEHGDEYFAELDLIETAAPLKDDFEAGVIYDNSESEEEKASDSDSDFDDKSAGQDQNFTARHPNKNSGIVTRSTRSERNKSRESKSKNSNDSDSENEMVHMMPKGNPKESPKTRSLRKLFGKNEKVYIMDAKTCGNVGRYFNHSCDPNLFVQSVFVDTHDMRFPWIAFFAARPIKAGEELTWNYNYEVGSVASKVLYCKCGSRNCRGRIL